MDRVTQTFHLHLAQSMCLLCAWAPRPDWIEEKSWKVQSHSFWTCALFSHFPPFHTFSPFFVHKISFFLGNKSAIPGMTGMASATKECSSLRSVCKTCNTTSVKLCKNWWNEEKPTKTCRKFYKRWRIQKNTYSFLKKSLSRILRIPLFCPQKRPSCSALPGPARRICLRGLSEKKNVEQRRCSR